MGRIFGFKPSSKALQQGPDLPSPSPLGPVLRFAMEGNGPSSAGDQETETKGGVLECVQCHSEVKEGEGARWKKALANGIIKWYCRCVECNAWNGRMDQVLKRGPNKDQWNALSLEQKKKNFRAENKDKFADELSIALTTQYEKVVP